MITIKKFFKAHSEAVLVSAAVLFLVVIAGFLYGTVNVVFSEINRAIGTVASQNETGFDLQVASQIDFRGLLDGSSPPPEIVLPPVPPPVVATSTPVIPTSSTSSTVASGTSNIIKP